MDWTAFGLWLSTAPLALIGALLFIVIVGAAFLGRWIRRLMKRPAREDADNVVVSSVLGLLALLLGFTFALATERFETRRVLVQTEANAIGTAHFYAQLAPAPYRAQLSGVLLHYAENRIHLANAARGESLDLLRQNDALLVNLREAALAAFPKFENGDFASLFMESVNEVFNVDASRKAARLARVPAPVFALLFFYIAVSGGLLGFSLEGAHALAHVSLFLALLTLLMMLVIDIDRPTGGGVRESQGPMERLVVSMHGEGAAPMH